MVDVKGVYEKWLALEEQLRTDLKKAFFLEDNFTAYANYSREYLKAMGKEIDHFVIEEGVRDLDIMKRINLTLDKSKYSYNDLVREITFIRRDAIAKSLVTVSGVDDVHSLNSVFLKYGINPMEDSFSKAVHIISQTSKSVLERKYERPLLITTERVIPNNMGVNEFVSLCCGYANSAYVLPAYKQWREKDGQEKRTF